MARLAYNLENFVKTGETMRKKRKSSQTQTFNPMNIGVGVLALVLIAAVFLLFSDQQEQAVGDAAVYPAEVTIQEAAAKRDAGAFILDVREQFEWDSFHIPGSTHIPLGELDQRLSELPAEQEVVVVCRTGNRSQVGRDILLAAGWEQATSMSGGVVDWQAAGYPIVSGP
jgi:rhodanese-related sulfurtransferase